MSGRAGSGRRLVAWYVLLLLALSLLSAAPTLAGPKLDMVYIKNGDRLTCEIKRLDQGRLTVNTDASNTMDLFWQEIVGVESPREFEVTLNSGVKYYGSLGLTAKIGELVISGYTLTSTTVPLDDVTFIIPIGAGTWARMDGNIDLGLSVAQANQETHVTLSAAATYRSPLWQLGTSLSSTLTTREDTERTLRNTVTVLGSRFYDHLWFATAIGQFQQNDELQLDLRTVGGGGFGKIFSRTNHHTLAGYTGLVYTHEQFSEEPLSNSAEIAVGGQVNFFTAASQESTLTNAVMTYYAVTGRSRARVELQSAWLHEFWKDLYWSVNGVESFDSDPPAEQKRNDFTFSLAFGWRF
jgi:hypothetical protein